MKKTNHLKTIRNSIQLLFLIITAYLVLFYIPNNNCVAHEFCPYSLVCFGVASLSKNIANFIFPTTVIIAIVISFLSLFFGRFFCGYICPFGTIQKLLYIKKGKKFRFKKLNFIKYIILILTIISAFNLSQYGYMNFCPVLFISYIKAASLISIVFYTVVLFISLFYERFFCKVLCPYGALLNIVLRLRNLLRIPSFKIKRDKDICINCELCSKECPMDIEIHKNEVISNPECILCGRCIAKCPKNNCLYIKSVQPANKSVKE